MGATANKPAAPDTSMGAAMDRIFKLLDTGSFVELSQMVECGVVTGYGTVDGRLVYVYSQYGAANAAHAGKIAKLYAAAMQMGAPVVALLASSGIALAEGMQVLDAYGRIFSCMADASGVIPQIAVIAGRCMGTAAYIPALSDFVIAIEPDACLLSESPAAVRDEAAKTAVGTALGGAQASAEAGLSHFTAAGTNEAMCLVQELLAYLPSNNLDEAPIGMFIDDIPRTEAAFASADLSVYDIINNLADNQRFLEYKKAHAPAMVTGFARINGFSVGILANNGALDAAGCDKAAGFVQFCDAFSIPLVSLNAAAAYQTDLAAQKATLKSAAGLLFAFAQATVPRISILIGEAYGGPYLLMNSAHIGADITFAWDRANVSAMRPEAAEKVLAAKLSSNPEQAAEAGFIDQIIRPVDTRNLLIASLEMLNSKRAARHAKKHGSMWS